MNIYIICFSVLLLCIATNGNFLARRNLKKKQEQCNNNIKCKNMCYIRGDPHVNTFSNRNYILQKSVAFHSTLYKIGNFEIKAHISSYGEGAYIEQLHFGNQKFTIEKDCNKSAKSYQIRSKSQLQHTVSDKVRVEANLDCALPGRTILNQNPNIDPNKYHFDIRIWSHGRGTDPNLKEAGACVNSTIDSKCGCTCYNQAENCASKSGLNVDEAEKCTSNDEYDPDASCYKYLECMHNEDCGLPPQSNDDKCQENKKNNCLKNFDKKDKNNCENNNFNEIASNKCKKYRKCYTDNHCSPPKSGCDHDAEKECHRQLTTECELNINKPACENKKKCFEKANCKPPTPHCDKDLEKSCTKRKMPDSCIFNLNQNICKDYKQCMDEINCTPSESTKPPTSPSIIRRDGNYVCTSHAATKGDPHSNSFFGSKFKTAKCSSYPCTLEIYKTKGFDFEGSVEKLGKQGSEVLEYMTKITFKGEAFTKGNRVITAKDCEGKNAKKTHYIKKEYNIKNSIKQTINGRVWCRFKKKLKGNGKDGSWYLDFRFVKKDFFNTVNVPADIDPMSMISVEESWLESKGLVMDYGTVQGSSRWQCKRTSSRNNNT